MAAKKRILHLIQSLENGGCENMLLRTLPLLTDFEHSIITLKNPGSLAPLFEAKGIPVRSIDQSGFLDFAAYSRLAEEIRSIVPDTILTYLFHADAIGRIVVQRSSRVPIVPFLRTTYNHPRYRVARWFEWLTRPLVHRYLANSEAVKEYYVRHLGVPEKKITVIENGIDTDSFQSQVPNEALRNELALSPGQLVIICVANLHPNKGHRYLLEAFEKVHAEFPNTVLLLVGDGEERAPLETLISSLDSKKAIYFLGKRTDVPELLRLAHIFVLPTFFEGMSNALLEAMAARLAIVTTDIPENRSLIENGKGGLLVPVKDILLLAEKMKSLAADSSLRGHLGDTAQETIETNFSLRRVVQSWNTFLHAL